MVISLVSSSSASSAGRIGAASREASRAVHDALPLLLAAEEVTGHRFRTVSVLGHSQGMAMASLGDLFGKAFRRTTRKRMTVADSYDVLLGEMEIQDVVQDAPDVDGLQVVPATIDLAGAEIELVSLVAREQRLSRALEAYTAWREEDGQERLDYVFIDCPPSLGLLTVNAFVAAEEVLIPIQAEYYALEGLSQLLKNVQMIQKHLNPRLQVSTILLTMFDARTNLAVQVAEEVRTHFPEQLLNTAIPRNVRISEAPSYQQTVLTYDPASAGAVAYREAAAEIAGRGAPTALKG